jgi:predicted nucleic acid-binding Zn ribbon protein
MTEKPLEICPKERCPLKRWGKGRLKRQLGVGAGLLFKGSGFYITDYRSETYAQAAKKESEAASKKETKSSDQKAGSQSKSEKSKGAKAD